MMGQYVFVCELFERTCSRHSSKVVFLLASYPHFPFSSCRFCGSLWRNLCNGLKLQVGVNMASVFVEHMGPPLE